MHGECQHTREKNSRDLGINWSLWLWALASPGVNQHIFLGWIFLSHGAECDVIVYYPTASVSNRELAGDLAAGKLWLNCSSGGAVDVWLLILFLWLTREVCKFPKTYIESVATNQPTDQLITDHWVWFNAWATLGNAATSCISLTIASLRG